MCVGSAVCNCQNGSMKQSKKRQKNTVKGKGKLPKGRITPMLEAAIRVMVYEGASVAEAAEKAGYQRKSLENALRKPHVKAYKTEVWRAFKDSEAEKSFIVTCELRDKAKSENVRLQAAKAIMDQDGRFSEKKQVNQIHSGNIKFTPGYILDFSRTDSEQLPEKQLADTAANNATEDKSTLH